MKICHYREINNDAELVMLSIMMALDVRNTILHNYSLGRKLFMDSCALFYFVYFPVDIQIPFKRHQLVRKLCL
jgi:hypothetical protein